MSGHDFPVFPQATEDARALLARLYREIGVSAVAVALNVDHAQEAKLGREAQERLASLHEQSRRILAA
jgi:hypothetical protein